MIFSSDFFELGVGLGTFEHATSNVNVAKWYYHSYCLLHIERQGPSNRGGFLEHLCRILALLTRLQQVILTNADPHLETMLVPTSLR